MPHVICLLREVTCMAKAKRGNPTLNVRFRPEVLATLQRIADVTGMSCGELVREGVQMVIDEYRDQLPDEKPIDGQIRLDME